MKKSSLLITFISIFIDLLGFGISRRYSSNEIGATGLWIDLIYSSSAKRLCLRRSGDVFQIVPDCVPLFC